MSLGSLSRAALAISPPDSRLIAAAETPSNHRCTQEIRADASVATNLCFLRPNCGQLDKLFTKTRFHTQILAATLGDAFVTADPPPVTPPSEVIDAAWAILDDYNLRDIRTETQPSLASPQTLFALNSSVKLVSGCHLAAQGAPPLLGVCAPSLAVGRQTVQEWVGALGGSTPLDLDTMEKSVASPQHACYIKYNGNSGHCQASPYSGEYRGVILQLGEKQVGHLPLALFGEGKRST